MESDRRQFNRVEFDTAASLIVNSQTYDCQIHDLSLHGVLLEVPAALDLNPGASCHLDIPLSLDGEKISMELTLSHKEDRLLGLECKHIDLESITHLRRVVELNLGDNELLERDFESLFKAFANH